MSCATRFSTDGLKTTRPLCPRNQTRPICVELDVTSLRLTALLVLLALLTGFVGTTLGLFEAKRQEGFARTEAEAKDRALGTEKVQRAKAEANERKAGGA